MKIWATFPVILLCAFGYLACRDKQGGAVKIIPEGKQALAQSAPLADCNPGAVTTQPAAPVTSQPGSPPTPTRPHVEGGEHHEGDAHLVILHDETPMTPTPTPIRSPTTNPTGGTSTIPGTNPPVGVPPQILATPTPCAHRH